MATSLPGSHFKLLQKFKADYCPSEFSQYESTRTGLRVVVVDQRGPKVYGQFALATEIHDDSGECLKGSFERVGLTSLGSPHTLEHLVFMGSKSYEYKGFLDKLATRVYSDTNAWTDTDSTVYTLDTAGWEGFATILPVYIEHVILPTLTDAGCYTEVHHVDGTGHDAGVVYSEMQGTQNTQYDLMDLRARRLLYPESVGFRYETGGLMERLRVLTADRIREFHHEMYQPKNLCLVLIGEIDHSDLLAILDKFEDGLIDHIPRLDEPFKRPWVKNGKTSPLRESVKETVLFPEEDESMGEIMISFFGPDCTDDLLSTALSILLIYLCGSSIALLDNVLVEKEQLASAIFYETAARPDTLVKFTISGVDVEKLDDVERRFFEVLEEAASKPFDMDYLHKCGRRTTRQLKFVTENDSKYFGETIIHDHLYGDRAGSQLRTLESLKQYDVLFEWSDATWREFFSKWFVQANHVTIIGKPSAKFSEQIEREETERVKAQQDEFGEDGLKKLSKKLKEAQDENNREIPPELLKRFTIPSAGSVHFIPTQTAVAGLARRSTPLQSKAQELIDKDAADIPLYIHFEHIPTNFVSLGVVLCTHDVPEQLRPLLMLYVMNFFDTPVILSGSRVEYERVVEQLENDTVGFEIDTGAGVGNGELLRIKFQVEPENYEKAIHWIKAMLYDSIFDQTRLMASMAKLISSVPEEKRNGDAMASAVANFVHTTRQSTSRARNTLIKSTYLRNVLFELQESPDSVIAKLEQIRKVLARPSNFRVFVIANVESDAITKPVSSWRTLIHDKAPNADNRLSPLDSTKSTLSAHGEKPGNLGLIVPMPAIDSSYAILTCRGLDSYDDPQLPALTVALGYLDAVEGPLWVAVRGSGLAYGTGFSRSISTGLLSFSIYRSPDASKALAASRKTVSELANGDVELDELALEGAISSTVVAFANEQPHMLAAAAVGFANQVIKGIAKDWGATFMSKVRAVKEEDVKRALKELVLPVFDASRSNLIATCANAMGDKLTAGFQELGFKSETRQLSSFKDDYGVAGADEDLEDDLEDDGADDDDEEEENEEEEGKKEEEG